jgi:hypothetical protein
VAFLDALAEYETRPQVSVHNIMAVGELAFVTYYQDGLRVWIWPTRRSGGGSLPDLIRPDRWAPASATGSTRAPSEWITMQQAACCMW